MTCVVYKDIWSSKNILSPEMVTISSNKKIYFDCHVCKHTYDQTPHNKSGGSGCPFCCKPIKKLCGSLGCQFCLQKSCYDYKDIWSDKNITRDNIYIRPETVAINSNKKYIFVCNVCNHDYEQSLNNKTNGRGCPYCSKPSRKMCRTLECKFCLKRSCYDYKGIWSKKNILSPEEVAISSDKKYLFDCHDCNHTYEQTPANKTSNKRGCPHCVNKTELKVANYLKEMNINFIQQYKIGTSKRYDFYLQNNELIIEVDGPQHFTQVSTWKSCGENLQNDIQKMKTALSKGISVLRIYQPDIWSDKIDWKTCINENLYTRTTPLVTTVASNPEIYSNHIN
jgi:very-short-patch-repair endonuclease